MVGRAARVQGGTAAGGQQRAAQLISQTGSSVLRSPQVSVTMTPADVTVEVTGTAERVLPVPGFSFTVTVTVTGPAERFVPNPRGFVNTEGSAGGNPRAVGAGR